VSIPIQYNLKFLLHLTFPSVKRKISVPHYLQDIALPSRTFFQFLQQHLPPICSDMASLICHFNSCRALALSPLNPIRISILLQPKVKLKSPTHCISSRPLFHD